MKKMTLFHGLWVLLCWAFFSSCAYADIRLAELEVVEPSDIDLSFSRAMLNRRTGDQRITVTLTNVSSSSFPGGILYLAIEDLNPNTMIIKNAENISDEGIPYFELNASSFGSANQLATEIVFANAGRQYLTYTPRVYRESEQFACPLSGLAFSPYIDGQDPNNRVMISEGQIRERMTLTHQSTDAIRSFGSTLGLENTGRIAREFNLGTAIGAWLDKDLDTNEEEILNLIDDANAGNVDVAIVGSEALLRGDLTVEQLIEYIERVREAIPDDIPVTTVDVHFKFIENPELINVVDVVYANIYPFWDTKRVEHGVFFVDQAYRELLEITGSKPVVIAETGWSSDGEPVGQAVPSEENAARYFKEFVTWAEAEDVEYFYFSALDETWKSTVEGELGAHWGIFDKNGQIKSGMVQTLNCERQQPEWNNPFISFDFVPARGSFANLRGSAYFLDPSMYSVVVYIQVRGALWVKPTFANPKTSINDDGTWTTDLTTGGIDQLAERIYAFLIPGSYNPPLLGGARAFPQGLLDTAIDRIEVGR